MASANNSPPTSLSYSPPLSEILSSFDHHGAVVLTDFSSAELFSKAKHDICASSTALAAKSPTFVKDFLLEKKLLEFLGARLAKTTKIWHGEERLTNTSRPQLSATVAFDLPAGRKAEPLHRHDDIYFVDYPLDIAVEVWALWNLGDKEMALGVVVRISYWATIGSKKSGASAEHTVNSTVEPLDLAETETGSQTATK